MGRDRGPYRAERLWTRSGTFVAEVDLPVIVMSVSRCIIACDCGSLHGGHLARLTAGEQGTGENFHGNRSGPLPRPDQHGAVAEHVHVRGGQCGLDVGPAKRDNSL